MRMVGMGMRVTGMGMRDDRDGDEEDSMSQNVMIGWTPCNLPNPCQEDMNYPLPPPMFIEHTYH